MRRRHHDEDIEAEAGQLLLGGRGRALPARQPRGRVGGGRDVRHRHLDAQGAAHRREAGGIQAIEGPRPPQLAQTASVLSKSTVLPLPNIIYHARIL